MDNLPITPVKKRNKIIIFSALLVIILLIGWFVFTDQSSQNPVSQQQNKYPEEQIFKDTVDDPAVGNKATAKIRMVEFGDFQCPFCKQTFPIVREAMEKYKKDLYFVFRDFPVMDSHPQALIAAQAANCANKQNKFWQLHDRLYANQDNLLEADLQKYASQAGLDMAKFNSCLKEGKIKDEIALDYDDGLALGVGGTPTFFINGYKISGAVSREVFFSILDAALKE